LIVWLMDAHETGNTEKNPDVWRTLRALSAERDALEAAEMSAKHWHARAETAEAEQLEQSRLLGMSAERELSLRTKLKAAEAERDALKAELAEAVGALQNIESRPDKMTWGEDYEVSEAMRDMEETARAFLARHQKGTDT